MEIYQQHIKKFQEAYQKINAQFKLISSLRVIFILAVFILLYFFLSSQKNIFLYTAIAVFIGFLWLVKEHVKNVYKRNITKAFIRINENEHNYLTQQKLSHADGSTYKTPGHPYSNDLDLLGEKSVFHHINRTETIIGEKKLAQWLQHLLPKDQIEPQQEAIKELSEKLEWRQNVEAYAYLANETEEQLQLLQSWKDSELKPISSLTVYLSYITPFIFAGGLIAYFVTDQTLYSNIAFYTFLVNVFMLFSNFKKFKAEMAYTSKADDILKNYSVILSAIESASFESSKLKDLQQKLYHKNSSASSRIKHLSGLFSQLDNIQNPIGAIIINGIYPYHFGVYKRLTQAKKEIAHSLPEWLDVIGTVDALNSLANFAYNQKDYTYPTLNFEEQIAFKALGHPLIQTSERVTNDVSFDTYPFIVLTGSNMSGKSTFLRSLGVNMVLAQIGAPVCAQEASIHPFPIWVSMRLEDNLNENESYFYAEVKRLKQIMQEVDRKRTFVLLDEILRGTNSDDKRSGTIEVIRKLVGKKCVGVIATHDLEVCKTRDEFPDYLRNMRFEADIINDELHFDYQLREGICENKNATFLMKKMGVI